MRLFAISLYHSRGPDPDFTTIGIYNTDPTLDVNGSGVLSTDPDHSQSRLRAGSGSQFYGSDPALDMSGAGAISACSLRIRITTIFA